MGGGQQPEVEGKVAGAARSVLQCGHEADAGAACAGGSRSPISSKRVPEAALRMGRAGPQIAPVERRAVSWPNSSPLRQALLTMRRS